MFELDPTHYLLIAQAESEEREDWGRLGLQSLARAYSEDEPEYSRDQIKEANAEYEQGVAQYIVSDTKMNGPKETSTK